MKLKMEMVGVGGTTAKQHDGDVSSGYGGCDNLTSGSTQNSSHDSAHNHNDEYDPTQACLASLSPLFIDPDVSDNTFITDIDTAHIGENEKETLAPQDDSPMSHDS